MERVVAVPFQAMGNIDKGVYDYILAEAENER